MLFNSYVFCLLFLPAVLAGWWGLRGHSARLGFLTLASYLFYGWWDYRFVPLMILSTSADFLAGRKIAATPAPRRKLVYLILLLIFNLGILAIFKYYDFFAGSLNGIGRTLGMDPDLPLLQLVLPVGISFYTFNSISYTIDIYRGRLKPARNFLEFSAFVAMFPHLVAGPIVRYADMSDQFRTVPPRPRSGEWVVGFWMFVLGMAKKVLVADVLAGELVDPLWDHALGLDAGEAWLAVLGYTLQIYFDFSGYSDMAEGLALLLGFRFPQNFDSPYQSRNIAEFWRRWHMSLSFWMRDYLYIPLGGSRGTKGLVLRNLFVTMVLGGLWHGADWTFVAWGIYHGLLLGGHALARDRGWVPRSSALSVAATIQAVKVGWVLFRADSLAQAFGVLGAMTGWRAGEGGLEYLIGWPGVLVLIPAGLAVVFLCPNSWELDYPRTRWAAVGLAMLLVVCILRFARPSPFLYFQF